MTVRFRQLQVPGRSSIVDSYRNGVLESRSSVITIHTDLAGGLPEAMADRVQLHQVLLNLMLSGIEATQDASGELSVKSQLADDGQLLISVADIGGGLPAENVEKIFDPFFTTKPQGYGSGIGDYPFYC